jgi:hypothetical protein
MSTENSEKTEDTETQNNDNLFPKYNEIKGELENLMGNVISFCPIEIIDANKEKLEMKHNEKEMYKNFYEKYIKNFKTSNDLKDTYRPPFANNYYGGVDFPNEETTSLLRGIGWDLVKQIGKKILSGDFNFTTVSIPIKVMVPISILQHICNGHFNYPLYMNLAYESNDPLQQMKYTIVACFSSWYKSNVFLKPLNPILGETYEMIWEDGSHEYVEQTSHHPPRSHFLIIGNENKWRYYGYFDYTSNGWFNSFKLTNSGTRFAEFSNTKSKIQFNYPVDNFGNTFWGTMRQESIGELIFNDSVNGYKAVINMGPYGKLSDYFEGTITKNDEVVSKVNGSYLEYIEIDGERYWDIRKNINIQAYPIPNQIKSSSIYRPDSLKLLEKDLDGAQEKKDEQENIQRHDRKLRKEWAEKNEKK